MNHTEQERRTAELYSFLVEQLGTDGIVKYDGAKNQWKGASGYEHRIDVSVEFQDGILIVECKRWGRKAEPSAALTLAARVLDIDRAHDKPVHGALVTNKEPGPGARQICAEFEIEMSIVESLHEYAVTLRNRARIGKHFGGVVRPTGQVKRAVGRSEQFDLADNADVRKDDVR